MATLLGTPNTVSVLALPHSHCSTELQLAMHVLIEWSNIHSKNLVSLLNRRLMPWNRCIHVHSFPVAESNNPRWFSVENSVRCVLLKSRKLILIFPFFVCIMQHHAALHVSLTL